MEASSSTDVRISTSTRWSLSAGLYMLLCAVAVALLLWDVLSILAGPLGLPMNYWLPIVTSPAFVIGAVVWYLTIERSDEDSYVRGGVFGILTALLTGLLWTAQFVRIWGVEWFETPEVRIITAFVFGIAAVAGVLATLPLMYARRRVI